MERLSLESIGDKKKKAMTIFGQELPTIPRSEKE
jgi:hypothetical protein